jgi:hypothetical protein
MCGFSDVRKREDGHYYCSVCQRDLGKEFDVQVALYSGKHVALQLERQCSGKGKEVKP